jgi:ABC-type antimicrobial peptide transport system permease subunit
MRDTYGTVKAPSIAPKQKLLIKVTDGASRDEREDLINGLRTFFRNDKTLAIDTVALVDSTKDAVDLMNLFFELVGIIAMIMCFFILWLSFTANVEENIWEFGVLRALGLTSYQVVMIYVYEALSLVLASIILGSGIGLLISITLTLQFGLFTELPFRMAFPFPLVFSMIGMAILVAILGSGLPAYSFLHKSISSVLRRQ